jgi:hypothetical protein
MALWPIHQIAAGATLLAARVSWDVFARNYLPFILLTVVLVPLLIKARRVWEEIHEVEEPVLPADLLETFEQAHADGEIDDEEFARIRERLKSSSGLIGEGTPKPQTKAAPPPAPPHSQSPLDRIWNEPQ